ncbi:MAG TPA: NADPH-dependent FMN reductase [Nitrosopumilaceae archaeon]|jgi:chromate reductase|nr:NADPH-dependent FMN reductase [Nitrosopumilaceae archaeon]
MSGITIFSSTNRINSYTLKMAKVYQHILQEEGQETRLFSFTDLPSTIAFSETFGNRSQEFQQLITDYIESSDKFVFVAPEYNGSYPGILKTFLDAIHPKYWTEKKAAIIGVSQGRAGNLRGIEQLTLILNYLKINVYHNKLPFSGIDKLFDSSDNLFNEETLKVLTQHVKGFIRF